MHNKRSFLVRFRKIVFFVFLQRYHEFATRKYPSCRFHSLFISIFASKAGGKIGVPALLLFLGVGMIGGVDGFGIEFNNPHVSQFIGVMALSVILFSGGMDTRFSEIKPVIAQGVTLATIGVVITTLVTGVFIHYLSNFIDGFISLGWVESFLLASIMSSTDSASVFSILRSKSLQLKHNVRLFFELESGSNDPMAYMLMIFFATILQANQTSILHHGNGNSIGSITAISQLTEL